MKLSAFYIKFAKFGLASPHFISTIAQVSALRLRTKND